MILINIVIKPDMNGTYIKKLKNSTNITTITKEAQIPMLSYFNLL
jgi:hypothetical protein